MALVQTQKISLAQRKIPAPNTISKKTLNSLKSDINPKKLAFPKKTRKDHIPPKVLMVVKKNECKRITRQKTTVKKIDDKLYIVSKKK